jgi:hypothetical protein
MTQEEDSVEDLPEKAATVLMAYFDPEKERLKTSQVFEAATDFPPVDDYYLR